MLKREMRISLAKMKVNHKTFLTIVILSFLSFHITRTDAANNFGADLELGVTKLDSRRLAISEIAKPEPYPKVIVTHPKARLLEDKKETNRTGTGSPSPLSLPLPPQNLKAILAEIDKRLQKRPLQGRSMAQPVPIASSGSLSQDELHALQNQRVLQEAEPHPSEDQMVVKAIPQKQYRGQAKPAEELEDRMTNAKIDSGTDDDGPDGAAFFTKLLKGKGGDVSRANKILKSFENLMTLNIGEDCDTSLIHTADPIIQYFGNLERVNPKRVDDYLTQAEKVTSQGKSMCDFRQFLFCDSNSKKCDHLVKGVVGTEKSGSKTVYKLGGGSNCFNFPKIFDATVEAKCADNTQGNCDRDSPGRCTCNSQGTGLLCTSELDGHDGSGGSGQSGGQEPGSIFLITDQHDNKLRNVLLNHNDDCTKNKKDDCNEAKHLTCQVDPKQHALTKQIADHDFSLIEAVEDREFNDYNSINTRQSQSMSHSCQCSQTSPGVKYEPSKRESDSEIICRLGRNELCMNHDECASKHCNFDFIANNTVCHANPKGLIFIEKQNGAVSGLVPTWNSILSFGVFVTFSLVVNLDCSV